jgi:SAM-dependent methyltransferase
MADAGDKGDKGKTGNAEQARYWTEEAGPGWVRDETVYDLMLTPFNDLLVERLGPRPGERVLEVGCGFGSTALALAARGAQVHGVDIAPPMIRRAEERAAAHPHGAGTPTPTPTFAVGDAQEDDLGGPYDAVVSRFGIMFFGDPVRAFANIGSSTRSGGRLVFVCWQSVDRNPWMQDAAIVLRGLLENPPPPPPPGAGPFAFADTAYVHDVLTAAGWRSVTHEAFEPSIRMGGNDGVAGAVEQALTSSMARALLTQGDATLRERAAAILHERFAAQAVDGVVRFPSATWVFRAER